MVKNGSKDYSDLPHSVQQVHWKVDSTIDDLEKECVERKNADNIIFSKFDSINNMVIAQLCATVLTLIIVIFMFITDKQ